MCVPITWDFPHAQRVMFKSNRREGHAPNGKGGGHSQRQ